MNDGSHLHHVCQSQYTNANYSIARLDVAQLIRGAQLHHLCKLQYTDAKCSTLHLDAAWIRHGSISTSFANFSVLTLSIGLFNCRSYGEYQTYHQTIGISRFADAEYSTSKAVGCVESSSYVSKASARLRILTLSIAPRDVHYFGD